MSMTIVSKKEVPHLGRVDVIARKMSDNQATTSRAQLQQELAKQCKADAALIIVDTIKQDFGSTKMDILARIYENKNVMQRIESAAMIKRNTPKAVAAEGE